MDIDNSFFKIRGDFFHHFFRDALNIPSLSNFWFSYRSVGPSNIEVEYSSADKWKARMRAGRIRS